jgi:hypothetical protein
LHLKCRYPHVLATLASQTNPAIIVLSPTSAQLCQLKVAAEHCVVAGIVADQKNSSGVLTDMSEICRPAQRPYDLLRPPCRPLGLLTTLPAWQPNTATVGLGRQIQTSSDSEEVDGPPPARRYRPPAIEIRRLREDYTPLCQVRVCRIQERLHELIECRDADGIMPFEHVEKSLSIGSLPRHS